jgi:hypothetical protein
MRLSLKWKVNKLKAEKGKAGHGSGQQPVGRPRGKEIRL